MPKIEQASWADAHFVMDQHHVALIRELAALHCLCPESCRLGLIIPTGELYEQTGNSAFHWSRCFEWPWAILNSELSKDSVCLDAAGGHAVFQQVLARRVKSVTNIDKDEKSLKAAKYLAETIGNVNLETMVGDLTGRLPIINDGIFDRLFSISVMEHIPAWQYVLNEMLRMLKPGGVFILTMDVARTDIRQTDHKASGFYIGFEEAAKICKMLGGEFPEIDKRILANFMPCGTILSCLALKVRK